MGGVGWVRERDWDLIIVLRGAREGIAVVRGVGWRGVLGWKTGGVSDKERGGECNLGSNF